MYKLVYLPDPTIKFYMINNDIYSEDDIITYDMLGECTFVEFRETNKTRANIFLKQKFKSSSYDKPYFSGQYNNLTFYEVVKDDN